MSMGGGPSLGTATFYITGNAQGAVNAATQANNALAQLSNTVAGNWWGLQNLGTAFAALPAAVTAGVGAAIKAAITWQDSMFAVERTTGATGEALEKIEQDIFNVARSIPLATTELAQLAAQGAALGVADENLAQFAKTMGTLITATDLTQANIGDFARTVNTMNIPASQWEFFANNLLEVGRNTAATEPEILNLSRRLAATAAQADITSSGLLGISAAVLSLGPRAEAGATAVQKTIFDMMRAISAGGDELETFAKVAGMSVDEFRAAFSQDAAQAFAAFVTGLDRLKGGGEAAVGVLDELGISEARQAQALLALAAGTRNVGSEQTDLNAILRASQQWGSTNAAMLAIQEAKAKTLSGQIQLLRNTLFEFGVGIGQFLAGPFGFMIQRFIDLLTGISALPGPLKVLYIGLISLLTAMSAVAAAAFLLGPRLFIAYDAFLRLSGGAVNLTPQVIQLGLSLNRTGAQAVGAGAQMTAASRSAIIAANNFAIANGAASAGYARMQSNLGGLAGVIATNSGKAASGMSLMTKWGTRLGKVAGWAGAALTVLSVASVFLGNKQREEAAAAEEALAANEALVSIMRQQGETIGPASLEWIKASERYRIASAAARQLGIDIAVLDAIITGQATPQNMDTFVTAIRDGGDEAKEMGRNVLDLARIYQNSAAAAGVAASATDSLGDAQAEAGEEARKNSDALKEQAQILEGIAQAHIDLADAVMSQHDAQRNLADAQDEYRKAVSEASNPTLALRRAELELAAARYDHEQALRNLQDREEDLRDARAKGVAEARDALLDLRDSQDRYAESLQNIQDIERQLEEVRAGPTLDELRDATLELRDAQLSLARAHQTVSDAEWYLQHLREEGASARDIEDAEMGLAEARNEVAHAEDDLIDATQELNDLRNDAKRQEKILDLERQLQRAYRDSERAAREVTEREEALSEARERVATDANYREAQEALVDAQLAVQEALQKTAEAELELQEIRAGRAQEDAISAAHDLEAAILQMAQANAEIRRQQALANGETWDAGDAAHALADELQNLLGLAPDPQSRKRLQDYINELRKAPSVPDVPKSGSGDFEFDPNAYGLPAVSDISSYLDELDEALGEGGGGKKKSIPERIMEALGGGAGIGGLAGGVLGAAFGPGGALVGAIVGSLIGSVIGGLVEKFWPEISSFFAGVASTLARNIPNWFGNVGRFFGGLGEDIGAALSGLPGTVSGIFSSMGAAIGNFISTSGTAIGGFFTNLPYEVGNALGTLLGTVMRIWNEMMVGIGNAITTYGPGILLWFWNLPFQIAGFLGTLPGIIGGVFTQIGTGATNWFNTNGSGILEWFRAMPGRIGGFLGRLPGLVGGAFASAGRWARDEIEHHINAIVDFFWGLGERIVSAVRSLPSTVGGLFADLGRGMWDGFRNALFGSPHTKIEYALWDMEENMHKVVANMKAGIGQLNNLDVDPFAGTMKSGLAAFGISEDYLRGMVGDVEGARLNFAASPAGVAAAEGGGNEYHDHFELEAITTADPTEIVNEYVWAKRVRMRGAG